MKYKMLLIGALLAMILAMLYFRQGADAATTTVEIWGALRPDSNGDWYVLGGGHQAQNISSVTQNDDYITVHFSKTLTKVNYAAVTPDETMVINDFNTGASVGYSEARVYFAQGGEQVNPSDMTTGYNIFFYVRGTQY